jgi:hypothetical protein
VANLRRRKGSKVVVAGDSTAGCGGLLSTNKWDDREMGAFTCPSRSAVARSSLASELMSTCYEGRSAPVRSFGAPRTSRNLARVNKYSSRNYSCRQPFGRGRLPEMYSGRNRIVLLTAIALQGDPYTHSTHTSMESPCNGGINGYFTSEHPTTRGTIYYTSKWGF